MIIYWFKIYLLFWNWNWCCFHFVLLTFTHRIGVGVAVVSCNSITADIEMISLLSSFDYKWNSISITKYMNIFKQKTQIENWQQYQPSVSGQKKKKKWEQHQQQRNRRCKLNLKLCCNWKKIKKQENNAVLFDVRRSNYYY